MPTILLTGLPRSGTTLTCALLNQCPDTVALAEPLKLEKHGDRPRAVAEIEAFVAANRRSALERGKVTTKHVDGAVPDNTVEPGTPANGLRRIIVTHGEIDVAKPLSDDFHLIIKHPAEFTALADLLRERFGLFAVVRHPLAVLAAWQTVKMPINNGRMPMAEAFAPGLKQRLDSIDDRLARQIAVMDWLLGTYQDFPTDRVLRYEDTTADPRAKLSLLTPHTALLQPLKAHEPGTRYPEIDLFCLAKALLPLRRRIEHFYPDFESSVEPYLRHRA